MEGLVQIDQRITLWLNHLSTPALDPFWLLLSDARIWFPAYGVVMFFLLRRLGWKKGLAVVLSLFVCVLLSDQLSGVVKQGIERLRPCYDTWMLDHGLRVPYGPAYGFFGFFSSHASNTFGFAVTSYLGFRLNDPSSSYKAYGWGVFLWATLVALSRIMMAAHYCGDVLVGILFGLAVGLAVAWATHQMIVKAKR